MTSQASEALSVIVREASGNYEGVDYPFDPVERVEAENVRLALSTIGHQVSLATAAAVWEHYSSSLQAGWITGPKTAEEALGIISAYAEDCAKGEH